MKRHISHPRYYVLIFLLFGFVCFTAAADASLTTYIFTGTGVSGVFNGNEFDAGQFTVQLTADPAVAGNYDPGLDPPNQPSPAVFNASGLVTLSGTIGLGTLSESTFSVSNASLPFPLYVFIDRFNADAPLVGFGLGSVFGNDLFGMAVDPGLLGIYNLTYAPFNEIPGVFNFAADWTLGIDVASIENVNQTLTFQAVPIPAPVLLLASGLLGLVGFRRKFKN